MAHGTQPEIVTSNSLGVTPANNTVVALGHFSSGAAAPYCMPLGTSVGGGDTKFDRDFREGAVRIVLGDRQTDCAGGP